MLFKDIIFWHCFKQVAFELPSYLKIKIVNQTGFFSYVFQSIQFFDILGKQLFRGFLKISED